MMNVHNYIHVPIIEPFPCLLHFRLGKQCVSYSSEVVKSSLPRQLDFKEVLQNESTTRSAWVFCLKSLTVGLSCERPICRWHPKNFSNGSWQIRLLKKTCTPGTVKRYSTSSINDSAATGICMIMTYNYMYNKNVHSTCNSQSIECFRTQKHRFFLSIRKSTSFLHAHFPIVQVFQKGFSKPLFSFMT